MMIHAFSGVERFLLKQFDTWTIPGSSPGGGATFLKSSVSIVSTRMSEIASLDLIYQ
jgi:hypothetical protein